MDSCFGFSARADAVRARRLLAARNGCVRARAGFGLVVLLAVLSACGGSSSSSVGGIGNPLLATSQQCANVTGISALYWDYSIGVLRGDYPPETFMPPFPAGGLFGHPTNLFITLIYPAGWTPFSEADPATRYSAVNVIRADGQAAWRFKIFTTGLNVNVVDDLAAEINLMASNLGVPGNFQVICSFEVPPQPTAAGFISFAARLLQFDGFTAIVKSRVLSAGLGDGTFLSTVDTFRGVGTTAEFPTLARTVFMPMETQFLLNGGNSTPECADGDDNDGDQAVDHPLDQQCSSPLDDSERN